MSVLEQHFDLAFAAPDGIKKLRELILTLAMQGKLVPQDPNDEPASELLRSIEIEKQRWVKEKQPIEIDLDEIPFTLPKSWEWAILEQLAIKIGSGSTPRGGKDAYITKGIPFLRSQNIWNHGLRIDDAAFISEETHKKMAATTVKPMDILLNITGASLGRCALVSDDFEEANVSQHVTIIRCAVTETRNFIHYFLLSPYGQSMIWTRQVGMSREGLSKKVLEQFHIPIPPLAEQRRIVAKIEQLMVRCDELEKLRVDRSQRLLTVHTAAIDRLLTAKDSSEFSTAWSFITQNFSELYSVKENVTELRKTILQLAVMGKLVRQDPHDEPASELLRSIELEKQRLVKEGKIKKSKPLPEIKSEEVPYELRDDWMWVRLGSLAKSIDYGTSMKADSDSSKLPVYRMGNIVNGRLINSGFKYVDRESDDLPKLFLQKNDLLFNRTNSYELVGKTAIYLGENNTATFASYLIRVRLNEEYLLPTYFNMAMNSPYFRKTQIEPEVIQQCGQANFNGSKLSLTMIPLPPLAEQGRIVEKIDRLMGMCDRLEGSIESSKVKQTELLNALMSQV
jgi:type I restriction enzyme, S subunit